jgi:hypothetical protein
MDSFALYQSVIIGIIVGISMLLFYGFFVETHTMINNFQPVFNITAYNVSIIVS